MQLPRLDNFNFAISESFSNLVKLMIFLFPRLHDNIDLYMQVTDWSKTLVIVSLNALDIKNGVKIPNSLEYTPGQRRG